MAQQANYSDVLYTPERVEKWLRGEISLQELTAISGPEMLQMAILGFRMYEQGRYADSKTIFHGLISLDPKESYYQTALGAVYLAEDDLEESLRYLNRSIELNAKELAAYVNRGEVYLRMGKVLEAAEDFVKAVELDPETKDPLTVRAKVLAAAALETIQNLTKGSKAAPSGAPSQPAKKPAAGNKPATATKAPAKAPTAKK